NPSVAVLDELRTFLRRGLNGAVNTIEKRIDEHITGRDAQFCQKALDAPTRFAHQDAPDNGLMLGRVLADDQHSGGAIQPPTMENGSPFQAKLTGWIHVAFWIRADQRSERFYKIARIEGMLHSMLTFVFFLQTVP